MPRGSVREAIEQGLPRSFQAMALEAARCGQGVDRGGETGQAQLQAHLERLARRPELVTFLIMVPESALVRVIHSPFE